MELTPEKFEKAEFDERRRGYDIDQVESFLEETGTEFAQMLAKFRHTEQRAAAAEERASAAESRMAQADSVIADATERVQRAERAARAAQQQAVDAQQQAAAAAAAGATQASRANEEAEIEQAAKTLLMAQRTADATVNEARGKAQSLLEDARARADRQQAESAAEAEELVRLARLQAEEEYASRRTAVLEEVTGLEARRAQLADVITQLEARLAGYRSELTRTADELSSLAEDPARLGARPTMSIPPDAVLSSTGSTNSTEVLGDDDPTDVDDAVEDYLGSASEPVDAYASDPSVGSYEVSGEQSAVVTATPEAAVDTDDGDDGGSGGGLETTAPEASSGATTGVELGTEYLDLTEAGGGVVEDAEADSSWGPGSWAQLESEMDPNAEDALASAPIPTTAATSTVRAVAGSGGSSSSVGTDTRDGPAPQPGNGLARDARPQNDDLVDDRPTQAVDRVNPADQPRDRFMQELDDAVNDTGAVPAANDEAMTAFFEGTSESKTRRFGWRR
ncbi:hypothetical protein BH10ACT3_BH10ACT3_20470 [soil metagenome]